MFNHTHHVPPEYNQSIIQTTTSINWPRRQSNVNLLADLWSRGFKPSFSSSSSSFFYPSVYRNVKLNRDVRVPLYLTHKPVMPIQWWSWLLFLICFYFSSFSWIVCARNRCDFIYKLKNLPFFGSLENEEKKKSKLK